MHLIPSYVASIRTPRLFCAIKEGGEYIIEQVGWFELANTEQSTALEKVNNALGRMNVYEEVGGLAKGAVRDSHGVD